MQKLPRLWLARTAALALALGCTTAPAANDGGQDVGPAPQDVGPVDVGPQRADTDGVDASTLLVPACYLTDHGTIEMICFDRVHHTSGYGWRPFCDNGRAPASLQPLVSAYCRSDGSDAPGNVSCSATMLANDPSYLYCIPDPA